MSENLESLPQAGAHTESLKCAVCSSESIWLEGFVQSSDYLRGDRCVCISCYRYEQLHIDSYFHFLYGLIPFLAFAYFMTRSITGSILLISTLHVFSYLSIVLHELGHWLSARLMGVGVPALSFGGGRHKKVVNLGGVFVILGFFAVEGLTILAFNNRRHYRKKSFVISSSGPIVNFVLGGLAVYFLLRPDVDYSTLGSKALVIWAFVNLSMGLANLYPFARKGFTDDMLSDGAQMLGINKMTDEDIDKVVEHANYTRASFEAYYGSMDAARLLLENNGTLESASVVNQTLYMAVLSNCDENEKAMELGRIYLTNPELEPVEKALFENYMAYLLCALDDPDLLEEADLLSEKSMKILPMHMQVVGIRGIILISRGRVEEGVALLQDRRFKDEPPSLQASFLAVLAKGYAKLGRHDDAAQALKKARRLDSDNNGLASAEEALLASKQATPSELA